MRDHRTFIPVSGTAPAFNSTALGTTASLYAVEATGREWQGPSNRSLRMVSGDSSAAYRAAFGTAGVVATTESFLALSRHPYIVHVPASVSHVSFVSSTSCIVNVALGYGGSNEDGWPSQGTGTTTTSTAEPEWTIQEAASITHVFWLDDLASWTMGDAAHALGEFHYSTST